MTAKGDEIDLTPPPAGEAVLPLPRVMSPACWAYRAAVWGGLLALLLVLLLWLDVPLMGWRLRAMPRPEQTHGWTRQTLYGLRDFGQLLPVVVAIGIVWAYDRRRRVIILAILLAQLLAIGGYNGGKYLWSRDRPYAAFEGLGPPETFETIVTWKGFHPGLRSEDYRSFPSGHSSAAFALAGVLVWFYPRLGVMFWTLAAGCAFSRVYDLVHWPGDCLAGGMLGYAAAWMALRPYAWALPVIWVRRATRQRRGKNA